MRLSVSHWLLLALAAGPIFTLALSILRRRKKGMCLKIALISERFLFFLTSQKNHNTEQLLSTALLVDSSQGRDLAPLFLRFEPN